MKASLLIVDDEPEIRSMLCRHFKLLGYKTDSAENGQAALDILNVRRLDIVISDIRMPVMSGVELLQRVRDEFPMIRVVMMTGYVDIHNALACMENQADDVIFKPFEDLTELEEAVEFSLSRLVHWQKKLRNLHDMKPGGSQPSPQPSTESAPAPELPEDDNDALTEAAGTELDEPLTADTAEKPSGNAEEAPATRTKPEKKPMPSSRKRTAKTRSPAPQN